MIRIPITVRLQLTQPATRTYSAAGLACGTSWECGNRAARLQLS